MELKDRINVFHIEDGKLIKHEKKSKIYSATAKKIKGRRKWAFTVKYTDSPTK